MMRQHKKNCTESSQKVLLTFIMKSRIYWRDILNCHPPSFSGVINFTSRLASISFACISRSLIEISESLNDIARMGPILSFIKSSSIKNEIQGHRQRLQDSKQTFMVCERKQLGSKSTLNFDIIDDYNDWYPTLPGAASSSWIGTYMAGGTTASTFDPMNITLDLPMELCYTWEVSLRTNPVSS